MADAPAVKPWGKADKDQLQSLIDQGKVDIERSNTAYIDQVRHKYFRSRAEHNFRRNFRQYARSRELEDRVAGYRRREGEFFLSFNYFIDYYLTSTACRVDLTAGDETDTSEADNEGDDVDDANVADDEEDDENQPPNEMAPNKAQAKKASAPARKAGAKSTGEEAICLDGSPPTKKSRGDAARVSTYFSTSTTKVFTVNPYSKGNKSLIDVVFHEGGYPPESAQPRMTLLPGGKVLQVEWKSAEVLFSVAQATAQKIKKSSSRFAGYADTVDKMGAANEVAIDGYHKGKPQVVHLDQECTGLPKTIRWAMRSEQSVWDGQQQQWHAQFNSMYVTTLKVARERHTVASGIKLGGISSFGGNGGGGICGGHGHTNRPPPPPPINNAPDHVEDDDDDEDDEDDEDDDE
jgi:hypothetical protein